MRKQNVSALNVNCAVCGASFGLACFRVLKKKLLHRNRRKTPHPARNKKALEIAEWAASQGKLISGWRNGK